VSQDAFPGKLTNIHEFHQENNPTQGRKTVRRQTITTSGTQDTELGPSQVSLGKSHILGAERREGKGSNGEGKQRDTQGGIDLSWMPWTWSPDGPRT